MMYDWRMKAAIFALILFAGGAWADETADRAAVAKTVRALNTFPVDPGLFTADYDGPRDPLRRTSTAPSTGPVACPEVWWETCGMAIGDSPERVLLPPEYRNSRIVPAKIRFVTPDVAVVDAMGRRPLLMVLKREGTDWKIASIRELADN